jgi:hypothetical protein
MGRNDDVTMFKPPRRVAIRLSNGVEVIERDPPGRFGPPIVSEGPASARLDAPADGDTPKLGPPLLDPLW